MVEIPGIVIVIYLILFISIVISEIENYKKEIQLLVATVKKKKALSEGKKFYSSAAWAKAKRKVRARQMEASGFDFIYCEDCGITSKDIDENLRPIVMSVGHDKARSKYPDLALDLDNLFIQCMPCNLAQGTESRQKTGYNKIINKNS